MSRNKRPRIAIPARLAESTSATRFSAIVTARKLAELIWDAGGEPLTFLPVSDIQWGERLEAIDGILLPGGADVDPARYGEVPQSEHLYGIDNAPADYLSWHPSCKCGLGWHSFAAYGQTSY